MDGIKNTNLDVNAILLIAGILLILYFLKIIMNNQERILKKLSNPENASKVNIDNLTKINTQKVPSAKEKGITKGDSKITDVDNDELIAVIMTAVSHASNIPLTSLKIKSIKKL